MGRPAIELAGKTFSRWAVLERVGSTKSGCVRWKCRCDCGNEKVVTGSSLIRGGTHSCGCLMIARTKEANTKHGRTHSTEYHTWQAMQQRCLNPNHMGYKNYGGRGIQICARWLESFENFLADMGIKPSSEHSLDRIDNNGNYEPGNCRWATAEEQRFNRRKIDVSKRKRDPKGRFFQLAH